MPKVALLFFGIHFKEYHNSARGLIRVDFRETSSNIKDLIKKLRTGFGETDVFVSTNRSPILEQYLRFLSPVKQTVSEDNRNRKILSLLHLLKQHIEETGATYDTVFMTRPDIVFRERIVPELFSSRYMNLVSTLESPKFVCDNLYVFPISLLDALISVYTVFIDETSGHRIYPELRKHCRVFFVKDEKVAVPKLTFYRLHKIHVVPEKRVRNRARLRRAPKPKPINPPKEPEKQIIVAPAKQVDRQRKERIHKKKKKEEAKTEEKPHVAKQEMKTETRRLLLKKR